MQGWEELRHPHLHQPLECRAEGFEGVETMASIDIGLDRSSGAPAAGAAQPHASASVGEHLELALQTVLAADMTPQARVAPPSRIRRGQEQSTRDRIVT